MTTMMSLNHTLLSGARASLDELNHPENKIITIEDPVEYRLPRVNQVQVHEKIGLTFSQVLRTSLRQDPDILLVGEMRDLDTVEVGIEGYARLLRRAQEDL